MLATIKKKIVFFIFFFFIFIFKKKKKKKSNFEFRISNFKIRKFKKKKKNWLDNFLILFSWAEIEPSHWAPELKSWAKFILRSKPLSHWAEIWAIELWSDQAKPRSKLSSQNLSHQAIELRYELSRVKPSFLALFYYQTQGFIKITSWVWGIMLKNESHIA